MKSVPRAMMRLLSASLLLLMWIARAEAADSPLWDSLSPQQQALLLAGKTIQEEEEVPGKPWPRFIIYKIIKATPRQVAAVFWDCKLDPSYIPNCLSVFILSNPSPSIVEAEYTLGMPFFLPNEIYTARNELLHIDSSSCEISWKVLKSRYTHACGGKLILEDRHGDTLLFYSNLVEPGSNIASIMRKNAARQVLASVEELIRQVDSELSGSTGLLDRQLSVMDQALSTTSPPK